MGDILELSAEEQQPLRDRVYAKLKQAIVDGVFPSGTRLVEKELAERLRVSRTPVREALQRLSREGLVTILPRKGVVVESLSLEDVEEVFLLREALEGLAGSLAAMRIDDEEIARLEAITEESHRAAETGDLARAIELNSQFHSIVIDAARSPRLAEILNVVLCQVSTYRRISMSAPGRPKKAAIDHEQILEALKRRDPERAQSLLRQHASDAREIIVKLFHEEVS